MQAGCKQSFKDGVADEDRNDSPTRQCEDAGRGCLNVQCTCVRAAVDSREQRFGFR